MEIQNGYFIMLLDQIGNIGAHQIRKIKENPKQGFACEADAIRELENLLKNKETHCYPWDQLTVLRLWEIKK